MFTTWKTGALKSISIRREREREQSYIVIYFKEVENIGND